MDERRCVEVLRAHNEWRRYDGLTGEPGAPAMVNPTELGQALDHAIATIERVAGAPVVCPNRPGDSVVEALALMDFYEPDESPPYRRVRLVPDPQPDGQEGK